MTEAEWLACADPWPMLDFGPLVRSRCCGTLWRDCGDGTLSLAAGQSAGPCCDNVPFRRDELMGERRLRLFGCACCRLIFDKLSDLRSRAAVGVAERLADGEVDEVVRAGVHTRAARAADACRGSLGDSPIGNNHWNLAVAAQWVIGRGDCHLAADQVVRFIRAARVPGRYLSGWPHYDVARRSVVGDDLLLDIVDLLRDIIGNPFQPAPTLCGLERKPFHDQFAHVGQNDGFWLEAECPLCLELRTETVLAVARRVYAEREFAALAVLADALEDAGCRNQDVLGHLRGPGPHARGCRVLDVVLGERTE